MKERFEIINHGYEHAQYFQGCGVAFTNFDQCVTGCGSNAAEAYKDAVEQVYQVSDNAEWLRLPSRPRGINARHKVPASHQSEDSEFYWYVSIRFLNPPQRKS